MASNHQLLEHLTMRAVTEHALQAVAPLGESFEAPKLRGTSDDDYYRHGYAIIDLKRTTAGGPINVAYYQIRSWAG